MELNWPLMENNITEHDLDTVIEFLKGMPILTQSKNVRAFEEEWASWLGVKYSVFLNSGASANFISMEIIKHLYGVGEIIVPPLTWISDIASVIRSGMNPVFADINPRTLSMDTEEILKKINPKTKAVFMTHCQGFNGLTEKLVRTLEELKIPLIEDVCESHGALFNGRKCGSFGLISNFSYYFAHHMSTIEGGMICSNDERIYQLARMWRSHGMTREMTNDEMKKQYVSDNPDLNPDFIFAFPGYNMRNTEIGAVIGRNQLKRLDENNRKRIENFEFFLKNLDPEKYRTDFDLEGSCNYAFNLILNDPNTIFCEKVMKTLREAKVEFRRGSAGGGNQLRQPYMKGVCPETNFKDFPEVEHVHFFGFYLGNYPDLPSEKVLKLCEKLNSIA